MISEERGEISVCFRGNIARDLEPDTLRLALQGLFYRDTRASQMAQEAHAAGQIGKAIAALGGDKPLPTPDLDLSPVIQDTPQSEQRL